jgi:hypothetical protein
VPTGPPTSQDAAARPLCIHAGQDLLGVRVPVLSVVAAIFACIGALISLTLGLLILGVGVSDVVPTRWLSAFAGSTVGTFVLLIAAVAVGRRSIGLRGWRSAVDARFFWETTLSIAAAAAIGLATVLSDGAVDFLLWASLLAAYVTLIRWAWWTSRY